MKKGFDLERVNGEYIITENGRLFKRLGKISREEAEMAYESFKQYLDFQ